MTFGGVFWYGLVVVVLSFLAGLAGGDLLTALFTVAVNWLVFVLPVVLIRNSRRKRQERRAA